MNMRPYLLAIDVETGGFQPGKDALLAIGAVPSWEQEPFYAKVLPTRGMMIDPEAAKVNGYTEEGWKDAVRLDLAMVAFRDWLKVRPKEIEEVWPLAHNAGFDRAWIEWAEGHSGVTLGLKGPWRCSMAVLAFVHDLRRKWDSSCSLDALCTACGIGRPVVHSALGDAESTLYGYAFLAKEVSGAIAANKKMGSN